MAEKMEETLTLVYRQVNFDQRRPTLTTYLTNYD